MKRQSTSKLLRLMVAVFALFLLVMAGSVLSACGGETVEENPNNNTPAEVHKHTYGTPTHQEIAKCGSTGYDVYECTECGDRYAIVTAATGAHDFKNGVCEVCGLQLPKEYTAYDDSQLQELIESNDTALKKYLDTELGKINTAVGQVSEAAKAHKHDFEGETAETITIAPTCICRGYTIKKCKCGSTTVVSSTDIAQHQYAKTGKTVPATCTTNGQEEWQCSVCLDTYWGLNTADVATGHDFQRTSTENDRAANCITPELRAYTCTKCGEVSFQEFGEINPKRHSDVKNDDYSWIPETLWKEYVTDTTVPEDGSKPEKMPTNTLKVSYAKCPVCNKTAWKYEDVPCRHEWVVDVNIVETCEGEGVYNAHCSACGIYANQKPSAVGVYDDTTKYGEDPEDEIVPALGHQYDVEDLQSFYEVDRNEDGDIVTDDQGGKISANTTCWEGTVCERCEHNIAVAVGAGEEGEDLVLDLSGYVATKGSNILAYANARFADTLCLEEVIEKVLEWNPGVTREALLEDEKAMYTLRSWATVIAPEVTRKVFPREWHAWTLYNPEVDAEGHIKNRNIKLDTGVTLVPPADAEAPVYETCLTIGTYWYYCLDTKCTKEEEGDVRGRWITVDHDPLVHNWVLAEDGNTEPTCTESGEKHYVCSNEVTKIAPDGTKTTWKCGAKLKVSIDANKKAEITSADNFWEANHRYTNDEGKVVWTDEYLGYWLADGVLKIEKEAVGTGETDNGGTITQILEALTDEEIEAFAKAVMPQAHLWVFNAKATSSKNRFNDCFESNVSVYDCECGIDGCCGEEESCARWEKPDEADHVRDADGNFKFGTYYIYGKCTDGGDSNEHGIIEVTYCTECGYEVSRRNLMDKNHRHFPFNRTMIDALLVGHLPAEGETYADKMDSKDVKARLEYAKIWIAIHEYWFNDSMDNQYPVDLFEYLYTKSNPKSGDKFTVFCFDCFMPVYDYVVDVEHTCSGFNFESDAKQKFYVIDPETKEYIEVTTENALTYNVDEYVFFEQYELKCKDCGKTFRYATAKGEGLGRYTRLTVDAKGKNVEPAGVHYLVPAYQYWTRDSYEKHDDGTVTMDWICTVCGTIVERTVKYDVPETKTKEAAEKQIIDLAADEKYVLLVGINGLDIENELNDRDTDNESKQVFQLQGIQYFGNWASGCKKATYEANATVIVSSDGATIYVGTKKLGEEEETYFQDKVQNDKGSEDYQAWNLGSVLQLTDFIDPKSDEGKKEYAALWEELYGSSHEAAAQALVKNGGNVVLGGDVSMPEAWEVEDGENVIDLNEHKLTLTKSYVEITGGASLTIKGGVINATDQNPENEENTIMVNGTNAVLTLENVTYLGEMNNKDSNQRGLSAANNGKLIIRNSTLIKGGAAPVIETNNLNRSAEFEIYESTIASYGVGHTGMIINNDKMKITAKDSTFYGTVTGAWIRACAAGSKFEKCTFITGNSKSVQTGLDSKWSTGIQAPEATRAALMIGDGAGTYGNVDLELVECTMQRSYEWFNDRSSNSNINDSSITKVEKGKTVEYDQTKHTFEFPEYKPATSASATLIPLISISAGVSGEGDEAKTNLVKVTMDEDTFKTIGGTIEALTNFFKPNYQTEGGNGANVFFGKNGTATTTASDVTVVEQVVIKVGMSEFKFGKSAQVTP